MRDEHGGIITGFLLRMVILFALLGVTIYEAGAVIVSKVAVEGIANDAAREAAVRYDQTSGSTNKAKRECERLAARADAECVSLKIQDGFVRTTVRKEASTLIIHRIAGLSRHTVAEGSGLAKIP